MTTFVVRIWQPSDPAEARDDLRGIIENAATGDAIRFSGAEELLAFISAPAAPESSLNPP
ncbi:MAG: hypothetical protein GEU71_00860 [Actinobacteria bacterium]|nr:hypothetical protein [Actinomycetota bacterium]